jgi:hypothetical protein
MARACVCWRVCGGVCVDPQDRVFHPQQHPAPHRSQRRAEYGAAERQHLLRVALWQPQHHRELGGHGQREQAALRHARQVRQLRHPAGCRLQQLMRSRLALIHPTRCSAHVRYIPEALDALVPEAPYVTVLRNPVSHFVSSWFHWHVWEHIQQGGGPKLTPDEVRHRYDRYPFERSVSPDPRRWGVGCFPTLSQQFLEGFSHLNKHLRNTDRLLVMNSFAFDLGLDSPTSDALDGVSGSTPADVLLPTLPRPGSFSPPPPPAFTHRGAWCSLSKRWNGASPWS